MTAPTPDLAILGGGLSGALIALAMAEHRPDLRIALIEKEESLGGHHVWSFFASDLGPAETALVEPLIAARWPGYSVQFPGYSRRLATPYRSATSENLDRVLRCTIPRESLLTGRVVVGADATRVTFADGTRMEAGGVIDARGMMRMPHMRGGWQTFLGRQLRLSAPHGLTEPIVMDANVEQTDGYRFVYVLPFDARTLFVEDTYYADRPEIDRDLLRARVAAYALGRGWTVTDVLYEETGVLPVIARGDLDAFLATGAPGCAPGLARAGTRAALVHPLTSYSLPDAARFAVHVSRLDNLSGLSLGRVSHAWAAHHWREGRFYRMLARLLFGAATPAQRRRIFERFYMLPETLIERFYAGRSTLADQARVLAGKPPVPPIAALASLLGRGRPLADLGEATP